MTEPAYTCEWCYRPFHTDIGKYRHENTHHDAGHDVAGMAMEAARITDKEDYE